LVIVTLPLIPAPIHATFYLPRATILMDVNALPLLAVHLRIVIQTLNSVFQTAQLIQMAIMILAASVLITQNVTQASVTTTIALPPAPHSSRMEGIVTAATATQTLSVPQATATLPVTINAIPTAVPTKCGVPIPMDATVVKIKNVPQPIATPPLTYAPPHAAAPMLMGATLTDASVPSDKNVPQATAIPLATTSVSPIVTTLPSQQTTASVVTTLNVLLGSVVKPLTYVLLLVVLPRMDFTVMDAIALMEDNARLDSAAIPLCVALIALSLQMGTIMLDVLAPITLSVLPISAIITNANLHVL